MAMQPYQRPQQQDLMPQNQSQQMYQPQDIQQSITQPNMEQIPTQNGGQMQNVQAAKEGEMQLSKLLQFFLLSRISEMSQEELEALDDLITTENITILAKLLPELIPIFEHASAFNDSGVEEENDSDEDNEDESPQNPLTEDDNCNDEEEKMGMNHNVSRGLIR